jgi:hypothetical protein
MKKNLNEEISRIKSMMRMINEDEYHPQDQPEMEEKSPLQSKIDELTLLAAEKIDSQNFDVKENRGRGSTLSNFTAKIDVPVEVDENTHFTASFWVEWDANENDTGDIVGMDDVKEIYVGFHDVTDNLNDITDSDIQPSEEALKPVYDSMNRYSDEYNEHNKNEKMRKKWGYQY